MTFSSKNNQKCHRKASSSVQCKSRVAERRAFLLMWTSHCCDARVLADVAWSFCRIFANPSSTLTPDVVCTLCLKIMQRADMDVTDTHQPRTQSFTSDLARPPPPTKLKGVKDYEFGICLRRVPRSSAFGEFMEHKSVSRRPSDFPPTPKRGRC